MSISIIILIGIFGLFALYYGGELLVTGTVSTAKQLKIPAHLIAVTIVAFGTSSPELFVSVNAVLKGSPDIAWGNVVGSNIANLLLVVGTASLLAPLTSNSNYLNRDLLWMLLSTLLLIFSAFFLNGINSIVGFGFIIILFFILFLMSKQIQEKEFKEIESEQNNPLLNYISSLSKLKRFLGITRKNKYETTFSKPLIAQTLPIIFTIIGIIIVLIGSELLIFSAKKISQLFKIEESVIGLTIVALGTSLPEVSASIIATRRGHTDIAIGNVIGSNIFNSLGIIGSAGIASYPLLLVIPENFIKFDIPLLLFVTLFLCSYLIIFKTIHKLTGVVFTVLYLMYLLIIFQ